MKSKLGVLATVLVSLWMQPAFGQPALLKRIDGTTLTTTEVDRTVQRLVDRAQVTGLALAVLNGNQVAYAKAYGYKNAKTSEPLDTGTVLYGASFSKAVFACLSLLLVQESRLDLDKPLYQYLDGPLPAYEGYADLAGDDRWKLITARMCLSHTTGLPNWRFLNARTGDYEKEGKLAIYFTPGTRYAYSGEGLALLQVVIEKITGQNLEALAREKVFVPVGMERTSYVWQPRFEANYALGHDEAGEPLRKKKRTRAGGAGSMETTLADYARFVAYVMQGKGLNQNTRTLMLTPQIRIRSKYQFPTISDETTTDHEAIELSYGLGWGLLKSKYGRAFFKEGHDEGWQHYNINFVDQGVSIILMTNSSNGEKIFKETLASVIGDTFTPWQWQRYIPYDFANH